MLLFQKGQAFVLLQPKHESFQLSVQFSLVKWHLYKRNAVTKSLKNPSKRLWAVIICNVCTLILCKLHCSATQRLFLSSALAGCYLAVRNIWKSGMESTALIPFFAFSYWLPWNACCTLAAEMFAKKVGGRILLCSTLLPKGEELDWAIVRAPQIRVTLAYLAACTDVKCRWSPTRALSFVYNTKKCAHALPFTSFPRRQHQAARLTYSCF